MPDYLGVAGRLRHDAADAALVRDLAMDTAKRDFFDRLHHRLDRLADDVEQAMNSRRFTTSAADSAMGESPAHYPHIDPGWL